MPSVNKRPILRMFLLTMCFVFSGHTHADCFGEKNTPRTIRNASIGGFLTFSVFWAMWEVVNSRHLSAYQCLDGEKSYCCKFDKPVFNNTVALINGDTCQTTLEHSSSCAEGSHMFCRQKNQAFGNSSYEEKPAAAWLKIVLTGLGGALIGIFGKTLVHSYGLRDARLVTLPE